eukprot:gene16441-22414_t
MRSTYILFILLAYLLFIYGENFSNLVGQHTKLNDQIELVYQIPNNKENARQLTGVLALFHGCQHAGTDWWPQSSTCSSCIGLPVEQTIVANALKRNYAVIAITSQNRDHKCWTHHDILPVSLAITHFYKTILVVKDFSPSLPTPPLFLLGASSGGSFVGSFSSNQNLLQNGLKVSAVCVQIMTITDFKNASPSIFLLMKNDRRMIKYVNLGINESKLNDQINANKFQVKICDPKSINEDYFYRHNVLSQEDSLILHKAFIRYGIIDKVSFLLIDDPRSNSKWRE